MIWNVIVVGQVTLEQMKCYGNLRDERCHVDKLALSKLLVLKICGVEQCVHSGLSDTGGRNDFSMLQHRFKCTSENEWQPQNQSLECFPRPGHLLPPKLGWASSNCACCIWFHVKKSWPMLTWDLRWRKTCREASILKEMLKWEILLIYFLFL